MESRRAAIERLVRIRNLGRYAGGWAATSHLGTSVFASFEGKRLSRAKPLTVPAPIARAGTGGDARGMIEIVLAPFGPIVYLAEGGTSAPIRSSSQ